MIAQHQNFNLQIQPKSVSGFNLSLSKDTPRNIFVLADLYPDISAGLDPGWEITQFFCELYNIDTHISHLQTQTWFVASLSFDPEPDITKPTSRKIIVSSDIYPDLSSGIDYGRVISRVFHETFLLDSFFFIILKNPMKGKT